MRMRTMGSFAYYVIAGVVFATLGVASAAHPGTFQDRDGVKHPWRIDEAHTLIWDGAPYLPFGVVFEPKYLSSGQTEDNWAADQAEVGAFKLAGVRDVVIKPGKSVTAIPVQAWQKFIDLLETNGLSYGIELDDSPYAPLAGYVVDPAVNRVEGVRSPGEITTSLTDTKLAFYALCDARTAEVVELGQAIAAGGTLSVQANVRSGSEHVLLLFPQKVVAPGSKDWSLPDLWSEADRHRDRLISHLAAIKFGKGLRFFIDPFGEHIGAHGEVDYLIPVSAAYRLEYAAWLARKYATVRDVGVAWSVLRHDMASFEEATRLVPMWRQGRGLSAVFDEKAGRKYAVDVPRSGIWRDFRDFRAESVRGYMDGIADALKRVVADVPVVFTGNELQPFFQGVGAVGFDGLAVPARGLESTAVDASAVFSLAEHSGRRLWIISRMALGESEYQEKERFFGHINGLRQFGVKGFFVAGEPAEKKIGGADLLVWLVEYGALAASDREFAQYRPTAVYYPHGFPDISMTRLEGGAWWLPALVPARGLELGSTLAGYTLLGPEGVKLYVWSVKGRRIVHVPAGQNLTVTTASGERIEAKPKKGRVELALTEDPTLIEGIPPEAFLPVEVVEEAIENLRKVIARGEQKGMDVSSYEDTVKRVRELVKSNTLFIGLDMVQTAIDELTQRLKGLEAASRGGGENAGGHVG